MADVLSSGLFISEILADNAGGGAIDTDGDGSANKADEYIEIQNTAKSPVSLNGYQIWSEKLGLIYTFGPGDTIAPGGTANVLGEYTGPPAPGFFDSGGPANGDFLPDGQGSLWDNVYLLDTNTGEYVALGYGLPPRPFNQPPGFTGTTQVGSGETIASGAPNGLSIARDANGTLIETTPTPGVPDPVCFAQGTFIRMADGTDRAVEDLTPGDLIWTEDDPHCPLVHLAISPGHKGDDHAPVEIAAGVFGNRRMLRVSPQHRILVQCAEVDLLFGSDRLLVPALHLVGMPGVTRASAGAVTYYHLIFDRHRVVETEGMLSESLYPGPLAVARLMDGVALGHQPPPPGFGEMRAPIAPSLRSYEGRLLADALARRTASSR